MEHCRDSFLLQQKIVKLSSDYLIDRHLCKLGKAPVAPRYVIHGDSKTPVLNPEMKRDSGIPLRNPGL
jgi:hypothetical protein